MPFNPFWYQDELMDSTDLFRVIEKSRQGGVSLEQAWENAWELLNVPSAFTITVSKEYEAVKHFMSYLYQFLYSLQARYRERGLPFPAFQKENEDEVRLLVSRDSVSRALALPASPRAGSGYSATHFRFDETAHTPVAREIYQGAAPALSMTGGRTTMFSSPKGRGTLLHEMIEKADDVGARVFSIPWWHVPPYNPNFTRWYAAYVAKDTKTQAELVELAKKGAWYKRERPKYGALEWAQEFECQHDSDVNAAFTAQQVKNTFRKNWLTEREVEVGELWVDDALDGSHYFATGVDLGRKNDATVVIGMDYTVKPAQCVLFRRIPGGGSVSWAYILEQIRECHTLLSFGKAQADSMKHDATSMGGDTISEALEDVSEPFIFSGNQYTKQKYNLIETARKAMDESALLLPRIPALLHEFRIYAWEDKGLQTDCVMATLIALSIFYEGSGGSVEVIPDFSFIQ